MTWYNVSMEELNFLPNGQWQLSKAEPGNMDHYSFGNSAPDFKITGADVQKHQDIAYKKALSHSKHSVKKMVNEDGEPEDHIMLHRGLTTYNKSETGRNTMKITPSHIESEDTNVHTLLPHIANAYATKYPTNEDGEEVNGPTTKGKVLSFWVPKSKIHHMGGYIGESKFDNHAESQKHTSVMPGKFKRATPEEVSLVSNYTPKVV